MFNRLFTPKWEHSDPGVRRQALASGAAPAEAMAKAARGDDDPDVRRFAVEHLDDLELLTALTATEPLADIRELAGQRQRALLAATLQAGPPLDTRLETLRQMQSVELCVFLARQAQLTEIRTFALQHVSETGVLCAVATGDPVAAVRRAALERIEDPQGWEAVAREARNKDKQLSRLARERLEAWQQDRADRESAERLCQEMESLGAATLQASDAMRMRRLDTRREQLESAFSPPLTARYRHAREQAAAGIEQLAKLQTERRTLCSELEDLLDAMTSSCLLYTSDAADDYFWV